MKTVSKRTSPWVTTGVLAILVILIAGSAGCLNMVKRSLDANATTPAEIIPVTATTAVPPQYNEEYSVSLHQTAAIVTPVKSAVVIEVSPVTTPDPYPVQHGMRINQSPRYAFQYRQPEFTKTYTLTGNAYGLLVNVVQGPLYIRYTVKPKYDCLSDPDSCRGTVFVPVNRPHMTITVRDNQTQQIIAEDGYAREYSSDKGEYSPGSSGGSGEVSSSYDNSDNGNYANVPSYRYIPVYKEGQFQITIEGNYLDVDIAIITGASPDISTAHEKGTGPVTTSAGDDEWD